MRTLESWLAKFTLGALIAFAPFETWVSWQWGGGFPGLLHPLYIIDLIGMALMLVGGTLSLRARPEPAPGVLCAAHAWMAANGWRATTSRVEALSQGGRPHWGAGELWLVLALTLLTLVLFAVSLFLTIRSSGHRPA